MQNIDRRAMLVKTSAAFATLALQPERHASAALQARVHDIKVISQQPGLYHGWPTLGRRKDGQLLVVCSGGRESHVCPFGRVEMMRSHDDGQSWTWPRVLMDCEIDDRDAGVLETDQGTLLVTSFTSREYKTQRHWPPADDTARQRRWQAAHSSVSSQQQDQLLGHWMVRSTDGGLTWSGRYDSVVNSPHGPIQLSDGRQLYAGKELWHGSDRIGVCESTDDGQSWRWLAEIPTRAGDQHKEYHELHAVEAADGTIVAQIRNHNPQNLRESLQTESTDGGKTWSVPHSIGVFGYPSHLLRLADDRLLMTFGHRAKPLGNQARVSNDHGRNWSEPLIINDDAPGGDMGYPSTVQLDNGLLVSVWYEVMQGSPFAVLRQATWELTA